MVDQCEPERCHNPDCRSPLNNYPFSKRIGHVDHLFCTATCCGKYVREQTLIRQSAELSWLLSLYSGAGVDWNNSRRT
jgi:hypothetical protein